MSAGGDVILSQAVYDDPEVARFLHEQAHTLSVNSFQSELRGFGPESFTLWRVAGHA
ncbi:MAG: hypothetical protein M5U34_46305 [Chloroflexi bacterium]|nr:hypothetical protein [Chloroflexota bacterium]